MKTFVYDRDVNRTDAEWRAAFPGRSLWGAARKFADKNGEAGVWCGDGRLVTFRRDRMGKVRQFTFPDAVPHYVPDSDFNT
jgi:hypothetical protein